MLLYAANDFDTTPGKDISAELDRLHKSHLLKIYPAIGKISDDGRNLLYLGIPEWEPDIFQFFRRQRQPLIPFLFDFFAVPNGGQTSYTASESKRERRSQRCNQ